MPARDNSDALPMKNSSMQNDAPFQAAKVIGARVPDFVPRVALILGSGLGVLADRMRHAITIPYGDLPGFPASSVQGHAGELVLGELAGIAVVCMKGRGHFYEGHGLGVMTSAVRTMKLLGCEMLFVTNAVGSLHVDVPAASLVAISDHINLLPGSPMMGPNDADFGERFFSMANAYDKDLRLLLHDAAAAAGIVLHEGVYACSTGPNFETPAEIRMLARLGADVVGMSVVPEVISARHCGLKVSAVSVVTNLAEGLADEPLSHEQTLQYAAIGAKDLIALILRFLERLPARAGSV